MDRELVRLVVGFSEGSASHAAALAVMPRLEQGLQSPVVLEWQPGDGGGNAARYVADAAPDGRILLVCTLGTQVLRPALRPPCGYDPLRDFAPVGVLMRAPLVLAASSATGLDSVAALLAAARAAPGALAYASSSIGGGPHLAGAMFVRMTGAPLRHEVYAETGRLYADLGDGRVAVSFNNIASMRPKLAEGRLVGLAVTGAVRHPDLPQLPTLAEAGVPGYEVTNWVGLVAPAATPQPVIDALAAAAGLDPGQFGAFLHAETLRWRDTAAILADPV